jgi:methanogenic corrinoid protein MtbC1
VIKWCTYCSHYICECEPWTDYQITHGVCQACFKKLLADEVPDPLAMQEVRTFFRSMQAVARSGTPVEMDRILRESRRLRMPPMDLLLGILQPLLVEIGQLWEEGKVTVAIEHRFSALVQQIVAQVQKDAAGAAGPDRAELVLFNAEGNDHQLGLMMAECFFVTCGIATHAVLEGLPVKEVLDLLESWKPEAVGFSVALPPQMQQVRELAVRMRELARPPRSLFVGGPALRMGLDLDPSLGIKPCYQPSEALPFLAAKGH